MQPQVAYIFFYRQPNHFGLFLNTVSKFLEQYEVQKYK